MSDLDFKRMVCFFILCTTLFPNSYYNVLPRHLSFVDDVENLKNYLWGVDVYEEILMEIKKTLWQSSMGKSERTRRFIRGMSTITSLFYPREHPWLWNLVHKSFLSVGDNNDIMFHVDYRILHLNEELGPVILILWLHNGKSDGKNMISNVTCAIEECRNTFQLNESRPCILPSSDDACRYGYKVQTPKKTSKLTHLLHMTSMSTPRGQPCKFDHVRW